MSGWIGSFMVDFILNPNQTAQPDPKPKTKPKNIHILQQSHKTKALCNTKDPTQPVLVHNPVVPIPYPIPP